MDSVDFIPALIGGGLVSLALGLVVIFFLIHQIRETSESLSRSNARFQNITEKSNLGILIHRHHKALYVNEEFVRLYGYDNAREIYDLETTQSLITPESRDPSRQGNILKNDQPSVEMDCLGLKKDGSTFWVNRRSFAIDWDGAPAVFSARKDVTEQRKSMERLQSRHNIAQFLRSVAFASNQATNFSDALRATLQDFCAYNAWPVAHAYVLSNDKPDLLESSHIWHLEDPLRFETFRSATEAMRFQKGKGLPGRVLESHEPAWITNIAGDSNFPRAKLAKDTGLKTGMACSVVVGSNVVAVLEFYATESLEPDLELLDSMVHVGTHLGRVFERDQAKEALSESEDLFRHFFESPLVGAAMYGLDMKWRMINDTFCNFLGYTQEELQQRTWIDVSHPDDVEENAGLFKGAVSGEYDTYSMNKRYIRKDGKVVFATIWVQCVRKLDGSPDYFIVFVLDVTDQTAVISQLRQSQRMEAIGQLTGGVAHDFNNLLGIMIGNTELLGDKVGDNKDARHHIGEIEKAIDRASSLTSRLLAFSRQQPLEPEITDVEKLIMDLEEMLQRTMGETIKFVVEAAPDLWTSAIDPHQLDNALLNLAINAKDAMPDGGTLSIKASNITFDDSYSDQHEYITRGDYVEVAVMDTGTGMKDDVLDKVFEPFFTTKAFGEGSGLGLSMVYGFVKQSEGHVAVASEEGEGTTVSLYLPAAKGKMGEMGNAPKLDQTISEHKTILLVEDNPEVRETANSTLTSLGYEVIEVEDGQSALNVLSERAGEIDLVFSDVVMPNNMSGIELAEKVSITYEGIKVLLTSGYPDKITDQHTFQELGIELLAKPYKRAQLIAAIEGNI